MSKYGSRGSNGLSHSFINIYGLASCHSRSCSGPVCWLLFYFVLFFVWGGAGVIKGDICVFMKYSSLGQASTQMLSGVISVFL